MNAFALLLMLALGIDHSGRLVSAQEGGDPESAVVVPHDAVQPGTDAPSSIGSAAVSPPQASPAAEPSYSYCQCQSRGESACHCLKTGQVCHCPTNGPSKWEMADGRPVRKVPRGTSNTPAASTSKSPEPSNGYPVSVRNGFAYWTDSNGVQWNDQGYGLFEGTVYGGRFTYRGGQMFEPGVVVASKPAEVNGSKMAVEIQQPKGHFETRCFGTYCKQVWVPE